ncbi:hypothetical protein SAMN05444336_10814 [Albimonas donghaensis]|uniref:Uncharacterized protein n=1 Tax=Albimonas donghaensis TaxID=356660 RepID=A0A1H3DHA0_9RHOB|nr:hypothetical protein SAMN05444336_10814 [Albimonas donghaensis]
MSLGFGLQGPTISAARAAMTARAGRPSRRSPCAFRSKPNSTFAAPTRAPRRSPWKDRT